ncbi:MAG: M28 family peptidase [Bacteroidia bacterium]|nr:M28 family peptidase [Bacteroidia bacterium]
MKKSILLISIILNFLNAYAFGQDTQYVRKQLIRLCGPDMHGRGYYKHGDGIAAKYIADQFKQLGIKSFQEGYLQPYSFNINTINQAMVKFNGKELKFNSEFVVSPYSGSVSGTFKPVMINASLMSNADKFMEAVNAVPVPRVVVLDSTGLKNPGLFRFIKGMATGNQLGIAALIEVFAGTPGTYPGRSQMKVAHIEVGRKSVPDTLNEVELNVINEYNENYPTQNVIGYLQGQTDQYIVFTAHYDGYGSYGEGNYNAAAEDNASGTAMVMDLARHYMHGKKPYYSVAFMLFSGEEVGLMGSKNYVANPLFPLDKIKLVINLDMVMTGQDGVILFGGNGRPNEASIVQKINEEKQYMKNVDNRDGTANSDHYPFQEKGIPAIFFLTKGPSGHGHGPDDTYDKLPLYAYENLFKLVVAIPEELRKQEIR